MKHNTLITAFLFSCIVILSGCDVGGGSEDTPPATTETSTPDTAATVPEAAEPQPQAEETTDTPPQTQTQPDAPQIVDTTTIVSTAGETIKVDRTAQGLIFHEYEGKIILLEVYGDTCPHCINAIASYNRLRAKYPDDVVVIALESYGTLSNAGRQQYITIPKANTGKMFAFIRDMTGYNREAVPYLMILDRNGNPVYGKILANFPEAEIENWIQSLR